jgi:hypothetical protein
MRTTITLDPDVAARLDRRVRERGITFKEAVNSALRLGLDADQPPAPEPYVVPTFRMGLRQDLDWDRASHIDADLQDEETLRKLALGK